MLIKSSRKKIAVLVLSGAILITGAGSVLAADQGSSPFANKAFLNGANFDRTSQGNQMNQGKDSKIGRPAGEMKNPMSELVTAGTITQEQLDAIQESMKTAKDEEKSMTEVLAELVSVGTLTQEQADTITEGTPGKGNMMARPAGEMKNPLSELVTAGTITQDELDAIQESMKTARESKKSMTDVLAELVSAGTLTQEQADAVSTAVKPARKQ